MKKIHFLPLVLSIGFFVLINHLVSFNLTSISAVTVTAWSDHEDSLKFYFDDSVNEARFHENKVSTYGILPKKEKVTFTVYMNNGGVNWLRIDPGNQSGVVRLYSMALHHNSKLAESLDAAQIYDVFGRAKEGVGVSLKDGFVEVVSTEDDPYLVSHALSLTRKKVGAFSVPVFILSFFLYIFLSTARWTEIRSYFLIKRELPSGVELLQPLDGLRGIAAIWVVAEHSWPIFSGTGFSGVLIFFTLSGFLLAKPFVLNPSKLFEPGFLVKYGSRRLQRILPMYYLYILLVYWVPLSVNEALLHTFFIKGNGHLWTIPQEMLFYLIFPLLVLLNGSILRNKLLFIIPILIASIFSWNTFVDINTIYLCGAINQPIPFLLGVFLTGVLFSYFYYGFCLQKFNAGISAGIRSAAAVLGCLILVGFTLFSNGKIFDISTQLYSKEFPAIAAAIAGLLLLLVLCSPKTFFTRFLSNSFLCSLGTVSYSLYLLHPLVIGFISKLSSSYFSLNVEGLPLFLLALIMSYLISCFTYRTVEHPFLVPK